MSLFESYEDDIKSSFKRFDQITAGFQHLSLEQKSEELKRLDELLSDIESGLQSLNLESNRTGKPTQHYYTQYYSYKKTLQQYKDKYTHDKNYSDLLPSYREINSDASNSQRERTIKTNKTLEDGIQMIKMASTQVREDQKTAQHTLENLATQRERLMGMEKKMDNIDGFLSQTKKTLGEMGRRAIANKLIMVGIILILLVSIILIVWLKFAHNGSKDSSSHGGDSTTTTTTTSSPTTTTTTTTTTTSTTSGSSQGGATTTTTS
ncbi:putative v-SNARE family protein [Tieghemostelium lacteum]|uniref:Putative v-SNARE family protein n=1 Tax=Tieghemostelium lacteum TaxID=361077 RepID=A0A151Z4X4_TIELA|nr:putative v-SNARE family protein [Tieghemostelium lacteum]|eukprot:KYQ88988.1 putative v-SNARE family protein [Tieghemostelium lacteum]